MQIGDYLDLEKSKTYPCSDGSETTTVDVDRLVEAVRRSERGRCLEIYRRYHFDLAPIEIRKMLENGHIPVGYEPQI